MGDVIRKKIRQQPDPKAVASELGVSLATVYRAIKGMDLKVLRELHQLPQADRDAAISEMATKAPETFRKAYGVSRQYLHQLREVS